MMQEGDDLTGVPSGGLQAAVPCYCVRRVRCPIVIDADINKSVWQDTESLSIACVQPTTGSHRPAAQAKVCHDGVFIYGIFQVEDRFVRAVATRPNEPVWQDSCVEFFFTPQAKPSASYFNLEINCIGTPLMHYQSGPRQGTRPFSTAEYSVIKTAATLTAPIAVEMDTPVKWTVEYAFPIELLRNYSGVEQPAAGGSWRGNFYKCADCCSHPHWLSWSPIPTSSPDFHRPDCFGMITFE